MFVYQVKRTDIGTSSTLCRLIGGKGADKTTKGVRKLSRREIEVCGVGVVVERIAPKKRVKDTRYVIDMIEIFIDATANSFMNTTSVFTHLLKRISITEKMMNMGGLLSSIHGPKEDDQHHYPFRGL